MRVSLSFHGIPTQSGQRRLREVFVMHARHIERRLKSFTPDLTRLEGRIEKNPNHHLYRVSVRLKLPTGVLATASEDHDLKAVLTEALDDLERRLDKHVARLRGVYVGRRALSPAADASRARRWEALREKLSSGVQAGA